MNFASGKPYGVADDGPALDDAYHSGHGDTADADHAGIVLEQCVGAEGHQGLIAVCAHQRNHDPPDEDRAGKDDERIFEADYIAQTEQSRSGVAA